MVLVRTKFSEEISAFIIKETRIGELGTTLAATINGRTLRRNTNVILTSPILFALMIQAIRSSETSVLTGTTHWITSQKTILFIVTAVKTSNLT
jgi:hypothetical protein